MKRSAKLRSVGLKLRRVVEPLVEDSLITGVLDDITKGVPDSWVLQVREAFVAEFEVPLSDGPGLQQGLWSQLLFEASDPEASCLSSWIRDGFPLGTSEEIHNTGIFPATAESSQAIELSRLEGHLADDQDGAACNYRSFDEVVEHSQDLLDQLVAAGRVDVFDSWEAVISRCGKDAKITKMARVVKTKKTGEMKCRIVVDSRRRHQWPHDSSRTSGFT